MADLKAIIESGKTALGIEFGSTRIKAVLIDESFKPIASGSYSWENQLIDGFWTYSLDDIWKGLRDCYKSLVADVIEEYDLLLIGPHIASHKDEFDALAGQYGIPVEVIPQSVYGSLDGNGLIDFALDVLNKS